MTLSALIPYGSSIRRSCISIYIHRTVSYSAVLRKPSRPQQNHYQVLGIHKDASTKEIRDAFIKMSKSFHPDMNSANTYNHDKFVKVNEAYSVLSKPLSRKDYDQSLIKPRSSNVSHQQHGRTGGPRPHSQNTHDSYYNYAQYNAYRDMSQDAAHYSQPLKKISNKMIVSICLGIFLIGGIVQFYIANVLNDIAKERSDTVLKNATEWDYTDTMKRLELLKERIERMKANERDKID